MKAGILVSVIASEPSPPGTARLVLASGSPRRRELIQRLGVPLVVAPIDVDESPAHGESPWATALRLAAAKLRRARERHPDALVLAADTVVDLDGRLLGKPASAEDAERMLRALRGCEHAVHSAVAAGLPGARVSVVCSTRVTMRPYSDAEIRAYVATGDPMDKAGAYAIQSDLLRPVARIRGLYSTVVGLPLGPTANVLRRLGVALRPDAGSEPPWEPPV